MAWTIKAYIPVEPEEPEVYTRWEEAVVNMESLRLMQPENIYQVQET
jgi:hypothetical protein